MTRLKRQIIQIDEARCDGCGLCMPACPEGALALVDGKARLVRESFCDGLGACLGNCPQGALSVIEVEADAYDEDGVMAHLRQTAPHLLEQHMAHLRAHGLGPSSGVTVLLQQPARAPAPFAACPSVQMRQWTATEETSRDTEAAPRQRSELRQWPVQLHLIRPAAPFLQGADLVLIADCVPFACPDLHRDFIRGNAVAVACPKLDDPHAYLEKLTEILRRSDVRSLKVAYMEVPCCRGLAVIGEMALQRSGKAIPFESVMVNIQ